MTAPDRPDVDLAEALLAALDRLPLGVSLTVQRDGALERLYVNRAMAELVGTSLEALRAAPPMLSVAPEERERLARMARAALDTPSNVVETTLVTADGRRRPVEVRVGNALVNGETVSLSVVADLGARREMESALRASEARFRQLAEAAPDTITVIAGGKFVYANPAAVRVLGFASAEELMARPLDELLFADETGVMMQRIRERQEGRSLTPREYHGRRKDGSLATLEISAIAIEFQGQPAVLAIGRDVGARKRLQAELMRADRMATIGTLAAGVAHEINNPLTYVLIHLRRLRSLLPPLVPSSEDRAKIEQLVAEAVDGGERVARIVRDLLTFARPGNDEMQAVHVAEVLDSVLHLARASIESRARLERRYAEVPAAYADAPRLAQVFLNLVLNAVQAFASDDVEQNAITVRLRGEGRWIVVDVIDNGPGIRAEDLSRVFEPFFTTKPPGTGTGLGLTISRTLVESFGGELAVRSRPGEGAHLEVRLRTWSPRPG
jgi:PAS domain S-box-containing protein